MSWNYKSASALLIVAYLMLPVVAAGWFSSDRVELTNIRSITLYRGRWTEGRRSRVLQMECVGGSARCFHEVKYAECYNRGMYGSTAQWECKAELPKKYKFGKIEVNCEGYDYPGDPYVKSGSCGLRYTLDYVEGYWNQRTTATGAEVFGGMVILFGVIIVFLLLICSICSDHGRSTYYYNPPPPAPHPYFMRPADPYYYNDYPTNNYVYVRETPIMTPGIIRNREDREDTRVASGFGGTTSR